MNEQAQGHYDDIDIAIDALVGDETLSLDAYIEVLEQIDSRVLSLLAGALHDQNAAAG